MKKVVQQNKSVKQTVTFTNKPTTSKQLKKDIKKKQQDVNQIKKLFYLYSNGKQIMNDDQLFIFIGRDLELKGDDPFFGYIAVVLMNIKKIQQTTYQNFNSLFKHVKQSMLQSSAHNLQQLKKAIKGGNLQKKLAESEIYRSMYKKIFDLYSGEYVTLDFETAQQLWYVYLKNKLKYYKQFTVYLSKIQKIKIHRDLWNLIYQFSNQIKNIQHDYQIQDGWPVFIDKFVEFLKTGK